MAKTFVCIPFIVLIFCLSAGLNAGQLSSPEPTLSPANQPQGDLTDLEKVVAAPPSNWVMSEKQLYRSALEGRTYDVLLVPFQSMTHPISLAERKLMTYRLALEIRQRSAMTIAPIHLVYRALGNTGRSFDDEDVQTLASQLGVKQILWGFAGYAQTAGRNISYSVSIIRQHQDSEPGKWVFDRQKWEGLPGGPDLLPTQAFTKILDKVCGFIGFPDKSAGKAPATSPSKIMTLGLPETPLELVRQAGPSPLVQAYYLQLLGLLTPSSCTREIQKEFFIRSLALLWQADASDRDTKLLAARAYLYLDCRPEAVKRLGTPETDEAKAFQEYMNANLPDQEAYVRQIQSPLKRLMARLEQYQLKAEYSNTRKKPDFKALIEGLNESWQYLVAQKLTDHDRWATQSNIALKAFMDNEFPVDGLSMETQLKSAVAADELEKKRLSFEMLFADHLWKAVQSQKADFFSSAGPNALSDYDYLLLLRAIGETNLLKYLQFYEEVQGKPETALQLVNAFLPVFEGHPAFHLKKASILDRLYKESKSLTDREKSDLVKQLMENAFKGVWWIGQNDTAQQTYWTAAALSFFERRVKKGEVSFVGQVLPGSQIKRYINSEYPPLGQERLQHPGFTLEEKLAYIHRNLYLLEKLVTKDRAMSEPAVQNLIETRDRFRGNPQWVPFLAKINKRLGKYDSLESIYRTGVADSPLVWDNYEGLGLEYIRKGDFKKAGDLFLQFPPFTGDQTDYHKVRLSNEAYAAGNIFFWRGDPDGADPFYGISADLHTGSSASLTSEARMDMVHQDFTGSAEIFLQRAKRYNDKYAYRDYMSLMHITGQSDQAWSVFDGLIGRFSTPQIWTAALVGHRMNKISDQDLQSWLTEKNILVRGKSNFPARFALIWLIDRKPSPSWADPIEKLENRSIFITPVNEGGEIKENGIKFQYPHHFLANADDVKSDVYIYQTIARSYIHLKHGSYKPALEGYKKLTARLNLAMPAGRQLLPYVVFSAYKSGEKALAGKLIHQEFITARDYDMTLAKAVLAGLTQDHANALDLFNAAFNDKPFTEDRLFFPWYQMVELLEWLHLDTGEEGYLTLALSLAKSHQVIQPMFAWAFAFEAKYTKDPEAGLRALAYAQYLDRNSEWISRFSNEDKQKAEIWFEANSPFSPQGQAAIQKQLSL